MKNVLYFAMPFAALSRCNTLFAGDATNGHSTECMYSIVFFVRRSLLLGLTLLTELTWLDWLFGGIAKTQQRRLCALCCCLCIILYVVFCVCLVLTWRRPVASSSSVRLEYVGIGSRPLCVFVCVCEPKGMNHQQPWYSYRIYTIGVVYKRRQSERTEPHIPGVFMCSVCCHRHRHRRCRCVCHAHALVRVVAHKHDLLKQNDNDDDNIGGGISSLTTQTY